MALVDIRDDDDDEDNVDTSVPALPERDEMARMTRWTASKNIALEENEQGEKDLTDDVLSTLGSKVYQKYEIDWESCSEWRENTKLAMDLAMQKTVAKQYPWPKAANIIFPLMTNASLQFAARAYPAIVQNKSVAKGVVIGRDDGVPLLNPQTQQPVVDPQTGQPQWQVKPGVKQLRADRIGEHMSWQLLEEMPEWEPEFDMLLHALPVEGCMFKKSYFAPELGRNQSVVVSALKLVINYKAKSLELAFAATEEIEYSKNQIVEMERAGVFRHIEYSVEPNQTNDEDAPIQFLEAHTWADLDDDGYKEPYIITLHKGSRKIVRIYARYSMDDIIWNASKKQVQKIAPIHYYTQYDFLPNPEGGIYGVGFGQILRPLNEGINTTLNLMIDSGHLQVVGGGFIGRGISMSSGAVRFMPGEYKQVNATGAVLKDSVMPLPFPGPSQVLFNLLGLLIESGKEVASIKDVLTGEQPANTPATTTLALIEQGLRAFTAIYKRIHRSLKEELKKLFRLNRLYLEQDKLYQVGDQWKSISQADYAKGAAVDPVSDPSMVSDMQKLGRSQFLMQFAMDPMINKKEIYTRAFQGANIERIDMLFNPNPSPDPKMIVEMAKLDLKHAHDQALITREKASSLLMLAQGVLALTAADKNLAGINVDWASHQLDVIKAGLEALGNGIGVDLPAPGEPGGMPGGPPPGAPQGAGGPGLDVGGHAVAPAQQFLPPTPTPSGGSSG